MMLATFLDSAGGPFRLGRYLQRGLQVFRQIFVNGDKPFKSGSAPPEPEQRLVQFQKFRFYDKDCEESVARSPQVVRLPGSVFRIVQDGVRNILSNYLARKQMHGLAEEMRNRCACRLMSGSARFYTGLGHRIALYGFVGVSLGGVGHRREYSTEHAIKDLLKENVDRVPVSVLEKSLRNTKESSFGGFRRRSISSESDITILSEPETSSDDFEVLGFEEKGTETGPSTFEEVTAEDVGDLKSLSHAELSSLVTRLWQENSQLKENQIAEENRLKTDLQDILKTVNAQQKELVALREVVRLQGSELRTVVSQSAKPDNRCFDALPLKTEGSVPDPAERQVSATADVYTGMEIIAEPLTTEGGGVRGPRVHRTKRLKPRMSLL